MPDWNIRPMPSVSPHAGKQGEGKRSVSRIKRRLAEKRRRATIARMMKQKRRKVLETTND